LGLWRRLDGLKDKILLALSQPTSLRLFGTAVAVVKKHGQAGGGLDDPSYHLHSNSNGGYYGDRGLVTINRYLMRCFKATFEDPDFANAIAPLFVIDFVTWVAAPEVSMMLIKEDVDESASVQRKTRRSVKAAEASSLNEAWHQWEQSREWGRALFPADDE